MDKPHPPPMQPELRELTFFKISFEKTHPMYMKSQHFSFVTYSSSRVNPNETPYTELLLLPAHLSTHTMCSFQ